MNKGHCLSGLYVAVYLAFVTFYPTAMAQTGGAQGGFSDGGASHISYRLVEEYGKRFSELEQKGLLPGLKIFRNKLEVLENAAPGFVPQLKSALQRSVWYLIPETITRLPGEQTGLRFPSGECMYQDGREVFVSEPCIAKQSEKTVAYSILHEAVMLTQGNQKNARQVRPVCVAITSDEPSDIEIQDELFRGGFGVYVNARQAKVVASYHRRTLIFLFRYVADVVQTRLCKGRFSPFEAETVLNKGYSYSNRAEYENVVREYPIFDDIYGAKSGSISPFLPSTNPSLVLEKNYYESKYLNVTASCDYEPGTFGDEFCELNRKVGWYRDDRSMPKLPAEIESREQMKNSFFRALNDLDVDVQEVRAALLHFRQVPSFIRIQAYATPEKVLESYSRNEFQAESQRAFYALALSERHKLNRLSPNVAAELFCNDLGRIRNHAIQLAAMNHVSMCTKYYNPPYNHFQSRESQIREGADVGARVRNESSALEAARARYNRSNPSSSNVDQSDGPILFEPNDPPEAVLTCTTPLGIPLEDFWGIRLR